MFGGNIILVATRDVLSSLQCIPIPFPALSTYVSFGRHSVNCAVVVPQHSVLCESCPAHQVPVFRSLVVASAHLAHETVCY